MSGGACFHRAVQSLLLAAWLDNFPGLAAACRGRRKARDSPPSVLRSVAEGLAFVEAPRRFSGRVASAGLRPRTRHNPRGLFLIPTFVEVQTGPGAFLLVMNVQGNAQGYHHEIQMASRLTARLQQLLANAGQSVNPIVAGTLRGEGSPGSRLRPRVSA